MAPIKSILKLVTDNNLSCTTSYPCLFKLKHSLNIRPYRINSHRPSRQWIASLFVALFSMAIATVKAEPVHIYTEEFPPYNFTSDKAIDGVSTQIIQEVMNSAGLEYTLNIYPWARSYKETLEHKNAFIYSISRLEPREALFKWVGKIVPAGYSVFALKSNDQVEAKSLEDLKQFRIGTTVNDAREIYLISKGFDVRHFDRLTSEDANNRNYLKLKAGRIDVWPMPDAVAYHIARTNGDIPKQVLKRVLRLTDLSQGYYLATNLNTPDTVLDSIRFSLSRFKHSSDYTSLLRNWGLEDLYEQCIERQSRQNPTDEC